MRTHTRSRHLFAKLFVALGILPLVVWGYLFGPPPGHSGAPGELTCWTGNCHQTGTGQLLPNSQALELVFSSGAPGYEPGVPQRLRLNINDNAGAVFGFQLSVRTPQNAQAGILTPLGDGTTQIVPDSGIQYIEHTMPRLQGRFEFDWTPPAAGVGPVTFYVAANAANNNQGRDGDRIHLRSFVAALSDGSGAPQIAQGGVVHGATFTPDQGFAPNTFGTITGTNLVESTQVWDNFFQNGIAPTQLGGARVLVNGTAAFISFTGTAQDLQRETDQINFLFPDDDQRGDVEVQVETAAGRSNVAFIRLSNLAPALFPFEPQQRRYLAAVQNDFSAFVGPEDLFGGVQLQLPIRPARPGDLVALYATGFGPTNPVVLTGRIPTIFPETVNDVRVFFGQTEADVLFHGLSPFAGVYQLVVRVPNISDGDQEVHAEIGGLSTQPGTFLTVRR